MKTQRNSTDEMHVLGTGQLSFRDLDGDIPLPVPASALEVWYIEVRDIKIAEMDVETLARACRQKLYLEEVVPFCLKRLQNDPLAGEMYDGELIHALKRVPGEYWRSHPIEKAQFLALAERAYRESSDEELLITENDICGLSS